MDLRMVTTPLRAVVLICFIFSLLLVQLDEVSSDPRRGRRGKLGRARAPADEYDSYDNYGTGDDERTTIKGSSPSPGPKVSDTAKSNQGGGSSPDQDVYAEYTGDEDDDNWDEEYDDDEYDDYEDPIVRRRLDQQGNRRRSTTTPSPPKKLSFWQILGRAWTHSEWGDWRVIVFLILVVLCLVLVLVCCCLLFCWDGDKQNEGLITPSVFSFFRKITGSQAMGGPGSGAGAFGPPGALGNSGTPPATPVVTPSSARYGGGSPGAQRSPSEESQFHAAAEAQRKLTVLSRQARGGGGVGRSGSIMGASQVSGVSGISSVSRVPVGGVSQAGGFTSPSPSAYMNVPPPQNSAYGPPGRTRGPGGGGPLRRVGTGTEMTGYRSPGPGPGPSRMTGGRQSPRRGMAGGRRSFSGGSTPGRRGSRSPPPPPPPAVDDNISTFSRIGQ